MTSREALLQAREALESALRAVDLVLAQGAAAGLPDTEELHLVPLKRGARELSISADTARRWIVKHRLGSKRGGRWFVDLPRARAFQAARRAGGAR